MQGGVNDERLFNETVNKPSYLHNTCLQKCLIFVVNYRLLYDTH